MHSEYNAQQSNTGSASSRPQRSGPRILTRVQVKAALGNEVACSTIGPELTTRMQRIASVSRRPLQFVKMQVLPMLLKCPRCGERGLYRCERRGFLQEKVLPALGIFPWNCVSCRRSVLLRQRRPAEIPAQSSAPTERVHRRAA